LVDAVLTPHPNELTCGTGKWSIRLAERLGVPCRSMDWVRGEYHDPLISARLTEIDTMTQWPDRYDLILHDWAPLWPRAVARARRIYAANAVLAEQIRPFRSDVQTLFCPSSLNGNPDRGRYRVLTYGMAHKITAPHYEKLKALLDVAQPDYTISLSTAVHEGSPWDESLQRSTECLRAVFGDRLRVLGYLADDALAKELHDCDAVALFYAPALRANNTTAWAALDAGKPLVTNVDECSPAELRGRVMHIESMRHWPFGHVLHEYGVRGQEAAKQLSWEKLVGMLRA
jgi:hypothetical protein